MKRIADLNADGYAIGGLLQARAPEEMYRIIEVVEPWRERQARRIEWV